MAMFTGKLRLTNAEGISFAVSNHFTDVPVLCECVSEAKSVDKATKEIQSRCNYKIALIVDVKDHLRYEFTDVYGNVFYLLVYKERKDLGNKNRTTKDERAKNARTWYTALMHGTRDKVIIVLERSEKMCRFKSVTGNANNTQIVIAEHLDGVTGCMSELLTNIDNTEQLYTFFDDNFATWLRKKYRLKITYFDGFAMMLERV